MYKLLVIGLTYCNNMHDQNNQHVKFILSFSVLKFSYKPRLIYEIANNLG